MNIKPVLVSCPQTDAPRPFGQVTAADMVEGLTWCLSPDQELREAADTLSRRRVGSAPVVDEHGVLVGVLSEHDCILALADGTWHRRPMGLVGHHMTRKVLSVRPGDHLTAVANKLVRYRLRRLPVVETDGRLVGLIDRNTVLQALLSASHAADSPGAPSLYLSAIDAVPPHEEV